jgi:DNA-binding NarL/FixJ family response regulator
MSVPDGQVPVVIVDDQPAFRRAAAAVVSALPGFAVVGEAETEDGSVELVDSLEEVGLILMDINLEQGDGLAATRRINGAHPDVLIVLMSTYPETDLPADARTSGAVAYLHKEHLSPGVVERLWNERGDPCWLAISP